MPEKFPIFPGGELLDRIVDAGLWLGRLATQRFQHPTPSEHHPEEAPRLFDEP